VIGNDIVDLALARKESDWQRKGFLNKIFTQSEQLQILNSKNPEIQVWNFWSRKEAAYKIYNRQTGIRGYFPLQLECTDLEINKDYILGKVEIKDCVYFTKTKISTQQIHTIAVTKSLDFNKVKRLENRENIQYHNNIPNYYDKINNCYRPVSVSHHGKFEQLIYI
jgi:phosphopantetheinyl transferase (holo-ACP synthase)